MWDTPNLWWHGPKAVLSEIGRQSVFTLIYWILFLIKYKYVQTHTYKMFRLLIFNSVISCDNVVCDIHKTMEHMISLNIHTEMSVFYMRNVNGLALSGLECMLFLLFVRYKQKRQTKFICETISEFVPFKLTANYSLKQKVFLYHGLIVSYFDWSTTKLNSQ